MTATTTQAVPAVAEVADRTVTSTSQGLFDDEAIEDNRSNKTPDDTEEIDELDEDPIGAASVPPPSTTAAESPMPADESSDEEVMVPPLFVLSLVSLSSIFILSPRSPLPSTLSRLSRPRLEDLGPSSSVCLRRL